MTVFVFSPTILMRCSCIGTLNNGALCVNEIKELRISTFHGIISAKDFNGFLKLCEDHLGKGAINLS